MSRSEQRKLPAGVPTAFLGDLRVFYQNRYRPRIGMITLFTRLLRNPW